MTVAAVLVAAAAGLRISGGLAGARCAVSAASTVGIGPAAAGPGCGTESAGGILRTPSGAWSRAGGAAAVRCLSSARAILTARMLDEAWREGPARPVAATAWPQGLGHRIVSGQGVAQRAQRIEGA